MHCFPTGCVEKNREEIPTSVSTLERSASMASMLSLPNLDVLSGSGACGSRQAPIHFDVGDSFSDAQPSEEFLPPGLPAPLA